MAFSMLTFGMLAALKSNYKVTAEVYGGRRHGVVPDMDKRKSVIERENTKEDRMRSYTLASSIALVSREFKCLSTPPNLTAMVMSKESL